MGCRETGNNNRTVLQYSLDGKFVAKWNRLIDAAAFAGLNKTTIWQCCQNRPHYAQAGGYIWIYEEDVGTINERVDRIPQYKVENLPNEEWRDVECYEGMYQVSNKGRVKCLKARNSHGIKRESLCIPWLDKSGYKKHNLNKNGSSKLFKLHRLVAKAFIPNPENKPLVDHIDGNPSNNCVENLRWATYKENHYNPNTRYKHLIPVSQYSLDGTLIKEWKSAQDAAESLGVSYHAIQSCCRGNTKTSCKYKWKYNFNKNENIFKHSNQQ